MGGSAAVMARAGIFAHALDRVMKEGLVDQQRKGQTRFFRGRGESIQMHHADSYPSRLRLTWHQVDICEEDAWLE